MTDARRTAAIARATSASVMLVGILAVAVMTACSPHFAHSPRANDAVPTPWSTPSELAPSSTSGEQTSPESVEALESREYMKYIYG